MDGYIKDLREQVGHRPLIIPCASLIIYNKEGILLQKRIDNGQWCYHGGAIEPMESAQEAAKRELFEETGLIAEHLDLFMVASGEEQHFSYPNDDEVYVVDTVFTCEDFSGQVNLEPSEVADLRWFTYDEILSNAEKINLPTRTPIIQFTNKMKNKEGALNVH